HYHHQVRATGGTGYRQPQRLHDLSGIHALLCRRRFQRCFDGSRVRRVVITQRFRKCRDHPHGVFVPSLCSDFLVVSVRSPEEIFPLLPYFVWKGNTILHESRYRYRLFERTVNSLTAQRFEEAAGEDVCRLSSEILLIVPLRLLDVETSPRLVDSLQGKTADQVVECKQFLFRAWIPSEESQEIHERFRQITGFAKAHGLFAGSRICPVQRKYREPHLVCIPLAQLAVSIGFEQQGEVGKL